MAKTKKRWVYHGVNILAVALIVECFLCSILLVNQHGEKDCFDRIEDTTQQVSAMFVHALSDREQKLTALANILAANSENPDALLQTYLETFCKTQYFTALCIHRANGTTFSYGDHPHVIQEEDFWQEVQRLPYISPVFSHEKSAAEKCIYQAVPIVRGGETIAVLYGYTSLELFPDLVEATGYDGRCQVYIVDGDTGDFLMDGDRGYLGNVFDGSLAYRESKKGYDFDRMLEGIRQGEKGFHVFRDQNTGVWKYTYYMPMGINNWSIQLTVEEPVAFASYHNIRQTVTGLMVIVIALMAVLVTSLMIEQRRVKRLDKERLHRSNFVSTVQQHLLNAHTRVESIHMALQAIGEEMQAETVLLLTFAENDVTDVQYWPSMDRPQAVGMLGRNVREDFPMMYDAIARGKSFVYDKGKADSGISPGAAFLLDSMDVERMLLVPIAHTVGGLRGAICAVNLPENTSAEPLESVVYDLSIAITNLESHRIIKRMGSMDYMTGVKNRNSYEAELGTYETVEAESLWCVFVDANGLHELNNSRGHKNGDDMLCAVAKTMRKIFGEDYTYRMGGDEFLSFRINSTQEEMEQCRIRLTESLARKGYSVSVGFQGIQRQGSAPFDVEALTSQAEAIMYQEKWRYYAQNDLPTERQYLPQN